jgi:hypothetical protein
MSSLRVSIHNWRDGSFLTTIQTTTERSWVLDEFGKCEFTLSLLDAKSARQYLDIDNLVYIEGGDGLPAWGGVIDTDIDWNDDGTITYSAYSGEYLLKYRRTPTNDVFRETSAGALFERFINEANKSEDLLIRTGVIWTGGTPAEDTMDGKSFYDHAKALAKNRGNNWSIEPAIDPVSHRLYFVANYYERAGVVRTQALKEGLNIKKKSRPLSVQGQMINNLLGIGDGSDATRPTWEAEDADSRTRYRLREGSEDFSGCVALATVRTHTEERLKIVSKSRNVYKLEVTNVGGIYANIRKGDTLPLKMYSMGYLRDDEIGVDTNVRISRMRYFDDTDTMEITPEEDET